MSRPSHSGGCGGSGYCSGATCSGGGELNCPLYVILNGELADDNYHPTTQLITRNPADQMKLALQVLEPVTARLVEGDRLLVRAGRRRIPGRARRWTRRWPKTWARRDRKNHLLRGGNSEPSSGGVRFDVAHHPPGGGGRRPWTRSSFAAGLAAMAFFEAAERGERPPHLLIRGHVHRPGDSYDAYPTRALVLPVGGFDLIRLSHRRRDTAGGWSLCRL